MSSASCADIIDRAAGIALGPEDLEGGIENARLGLVLRLHMQYIPTSWYVRQ